MKVVIASIPSNKPLNDNLNDIARIYKEFNVDVERYIVDEPDEVFLHDVFAWTPYGLIKCRMGKESRKHEPDRFFKAMQLEPALVIDGDGTFEGADLIPLQGCPIIGVGQRTNDEGAKQVAKFLTRGGRKCYRFDLPKWHEQHLLGVLTSLNKVLWTYDHCISEMMELAGCAVTISRDYFKDKPLNLIGNRQNQFMPKCPPVAEFMIDLYKLEPGELVQVDISELLKYEGGLACATGVLEP